MRSFRLVTQAAKNGSESFGAAKRAGPRPFSYRALRPDALTLFHRALARAASLARVAGLTTRLPETAFAVLRGLAARRAEAATRRERAGRDARGWGAVGCPLRIGLNRPPALLNFGFFP